MGLVNGQMPYTPYPRQPLPNAGKSVIITKFNNVRQDNEFLADEIEEQKQWNSLLVQCITDVQKELDTVQQTAANLYNECQSLDETYERFSKQLDEEKRKLSETATKKRRRISEIKEVDAELAATLREEKDRSVLEIARLRDDVIDADIDVDSLTIKFQYELGKMITFPFWRLEEEIDEVISRWSGKSCVEESSKERAANTVGGHFYQERLASGSNKSSGRNKSDDCLEGRSAENSAEESEMSSRESSPSDEISVTSQLTAIKVKNSAEHSLSVVKSLSISESVSSQSNPPSAKDGCVETDFEFVEDLSFAHNDKAPTKLGKKISFYHFDISLVMQLKNGSQF
ncbi:uncharacterized protein LOC111328535 [Stylophora pistillata]|uniref:uncharacterized protein LOC111328535 n=1 Tax=Stylophora pistillata TaxID=50429 RepID=UPI000C05330D|nr:uncharacterized protein LOC111328535 [Stylophora pistillata]